MFCLPYGVTAFCDLPLDATECRFDADAINGFDAFDAERQGDGVSH